MKIHLYKITNKLNGKEYYGKTSQSIKRRFNAHCHNALKSNPRMVICWAIKKYGKKNFHIEHLSYCRSNEAANKEEKRLIRIAKKANHKLYNVTEGGEGWSCYHFTKAQLHKRGQSIRLAHSNRSLVEKRKTHMRSVYGRVMKKRKYGQRITGKLTRSFAKISTSDKRWLHNETQA